ncbi:20503_t:CDS:2 [Funneliformis geosporum]|uniref:420_t:CDS:1 n=1 Tax=Funneliformis geosporum TaxID=1117311 RepID=A0A9W4SLJ8_9GLOM|nr:20503_t:CDS:2 [Funneliformis geosporum]CAI2172740.1 420_t:CDS:2 [Funneliformis geosporum]
MSKKKIVIEKTISEFLDEKLLSLKIKIYRDDEFENVSSIDSKRFGKAKSAVIKEGGLSVIFKRIDIENIDIREYVQESSENQNELYSTMLIHVSSLSKIKLIRDAGSNKSVLEFVGVLKDRFDDDYYFVFESVDCRTLGKYLQFNELDWKQKVKIAYEIANALKFLHEKNIYHKNLTTGNILYDNETENIKLINYSLFKRERAPKKSSFVKKLRFWKRDKDEPNQYPKEYDIYCLGSILFQLTQNVKNNYVGDWEKFLKYYPPENVQDKYKQICKACCRKELNARPNIQYVVNDLYNALQSVNNVPSSKQSTHSEQSTEKEIHRSNTTSVKRNRPIPTSSKRHTVNVPFKDNNTSTTLNDENTLSQSSTFVYQSPSRSKKSDVIPQQISYLSPYEPDIFIPQSTSYTYTSPHNPVKPPPTYPKTSPIMTSSLITQDFITEMYDEFHNKVANCKMELSQLNDDCVLDYLNKAGQSENKVFEYIKAKQSFTINLVLLALFHQLGIGTPVNARKAFELYKEASTNNTFAAYVVGECFLYGQGISKNVAEAYKFYKKSAEGGFAPAYKKVGLCYDMGTGVAVDKEKAFYWIEKSAEADDNYGQYTLGRFYEIGNGCEKDESMGFAWYVKAADQGITAALHKVGICYKYGIGTSINTYKAVEHFKRAAMEGCQHSQVLLGQAYELGSDIEKNDREALKWFRMASDQNYDLGHYHLGRCYDFGIGAGIDWHKALEFYQKASVNGNILAISAAKDIQSKMQRTELFYW